MSRIIFWAILMGASLGKRLHPIFTSRKFRNVKPITVKIRICFRDVTHPALCNADETRIGPLLRTFSKPDVLCWNGNRARLTSHTVISPQFPTLHDILRRTNLGRNMVCLSFFPSWNSFFRIFRDSFVGRESFFSGAAFVVNPTSFQTQSRK